MKTIVQKSAIPASKAFVIKELVAPYFDPHWHFHPEYQLFLALEGSGTRFVGDSIKPFRVNDLVLTGPNLPHLWRSEDAYFDQESRLRTRGIVIYFQEDFLGGYIQQKEELEQIHALFQKSRRGLEIKGEANYCISQMMIELLYMKGVESIIQLLKILNILAHTTEYNPIAHAGYVNLIKDPETSHMSRVYDHIMKNFKEKISLTEVAAIANMSLSAFCRYFKSSVNKSFCDFLSEVRIGHACKLLNEGEINISQVCYDSGFHTLSNFNKQFKHVTGRTPLQYKKECNKVGKTV